MCGDTPSAIDGHAQVIDLAKIAGGAGSHYLVSRRAEDAADSIRRAVELALRTRVPVLLNIPVDFMLSEVTYETPRRASAVVASGRSLRTRRPSMRHWER